MELIKRCSEAIIKMTTTHLPAMGAEYTRGGNYAGSPLPPVILEMMVQHPHRCKPAGN